MSRGKLDFRALDESLLVAVERTNIEYYVMTMYLRGVT